jgi:hypothetical protein
MMKGRVISYAGDLSLLTMVDAKFVFSQYSSPDVAAISYLRSLISNVK